MPKKHANGDLEIIVVSCGQSYLYQQFQSPDPCRSSTIPTILTIPTIPTKPTKLQTTSISTRTIPRSLLHGRK